MKAHHGSSEEQQQALCIVRNIVGSKVNPDRIINGSAKYYLPIMLDGNSRKTICRLYFNESIRIGIINCRKVETIVRIANFNDIARFSDDFFEVLRKYSNT